MSQTSSRLQVLSRHFLLDSKNLMKESCANQVTPTQGQLVAKPVKSIHIKDPQYCLFGWEIIRDGSAAAIWDLYGTVRVEEGPKSVFLWRNSVQRNLPRFTCSPSQYISVLYKNGIKEHLPGPVSLYLDPSKHEAVSVEEALTVETGMAIVVYEQRGELITKQIIHGPAKHILKSNQWLHRFFWVIPDQKSPTMANRVMTELKKVRTIADQIYFNVENVRTIDDALISVNLMIFFCLRDIEKMFEETHDPVSEMINSVTADVIDFASQRSFEQFKQDSEKLNLLESYKSLTMRSQRIGYEISKVVFRGYGTNTKLQEMHNNAIETRTHLKLKSETEQQAQTNEDYRIQKISERREMERSMEKSQLEHQKTIEHLQRNMMIEKNQAEFQERLRQRLEEQKVTDDAVEFQLNAKKKQIDQDLERERQKLALKSEYLMKLNREVGLDVTRLLVSEQGTPEKVIRVSSVNPESLKVHLHE